MAKNRRIVSEPVAVAIAESKAKSNKKERVVPISAAIEIFVKPSTGSLVVRRTGRSGEKITSKRAAALEGCGKKTGKEFYKCAMGALGDVGKSMKGTLGLKKSLIKRGLNAVEVAAEIKKAKEAEEAAKAK